MEEKGEYVQHEERFGEIALAMTKVMFQMIAVVLEGVEVLVLDLPPRPCATDQLLHVILGNLYVAHP